MKALTVHRPPNPEPDDFSHGIEGELAIPMSPCARTDCGCDRAHIGLNSRAGSTTVMVTDLNMTLDDMVNACAGYLETAWGATPHAAADTAAAIIGEAVDAATYHKAGTVLRPWFDHSVGEWRYRIASGVS